MTQNSLSGHPRFYQLTDEENRLHSAKNKDYTGGRGDPMGNFYRVASMLREMGSDITPAQVAFIYMAKQLDAAGRMLFQNYEGEVEGLHGRLQDVSVYAKLIDILKEEERDQKTVD